MERSPQEGCPLPSLVPSLALWSHHGSVGRVCPLPPAWPLALQSTRVGACLSMPLRKQSSPGGSHQPSPHQVLKKLLGMGQAAWAEFSKGHLKTLAPRWAAL